MDNAAKMKLQQPKIIVSLIFILLIFSFHCLYFKDYYVDDAFISLRYAQNLANGKGLVFNAGERVEGYTSFLWTIILALSYKLNLNPILFSKLLGIIFALATIILTWLISNLISRERSLLNLGAALLLSLDGSFAVWAMGGLETQMFAFWVVWGCYQHIKEDIHPDTRPLAGLFWGIATLTRPEGLLFFVISLAHKGLRLLSSPKNKQQLNNIIINLIQFCLIFFSFLSWKYSYYRALLPNTYYAKTGRGLRQILSGFRYLYRFLLLYCGGAFFLVSLLPIWLRKGSRLYVYLLMNIGGFFLYIILVAGADWMTLFRFLVPVLPLVYLSLQQGLITLYNDIFLTHKLIDSRWLNLIALIFFTSWAVFNLSTSFSVKEMGDYMGLQGDAGTGDRRGFVATGKWLKQVVPPEAVIAVNNAGAIPYFSGLRIIDMMGLMDPYVSRVSPRGKTAAKFDPAYILSRKPMFIEISKCPGCEERENPIYNLAEYNNNYVQLPATMTPHIPFAIRREKLTEFISYLEKKQEEDKEIKLLLEKLTEMANQMTAK